MAHAVSLAVPRGESLGHDRSTPGHVCVVRHEYGAASPTFFYENGARSPRIEGQSRAVSPI
jgi:hypothetical protein